MLTCYGQASVDVIKKEIDANLAATQQELAASQTAALQQIHPTGGSDGSTTAGEVPEGVEVAEGGAEGTVHAEPATVQAVVRPQAAPVPVAPGMLPTGDIVTI